MAFIQEELTPFSNTVSGASGINTFQASNDPINNTFLVFVNGVYQNTSLYTLSCDKVIFTEVVPSDYSVYATYDYLPGEGYDAEGDAKPSYCDGVQSPLPPGFRGSTTLNPIVTSYSLLVERIKMQLGWPIIEVEVCDEQIYDFINQGIEWYTKYAGMTEEYLCFDSDQYECGHGIQMDAVFSRLGRCYCVPSCCSATTPVSSRGWDCDINDYRKVIDVFSVERVDHSNTNFLFSLDYIFAQQTYFSYLLGNYGFDLTTWHVLKDWLDIRSKMFALKPYVTFDERTQLMKIIPEPVGTNRFVGVVGAWVERPIRDIIRERWVHQYSLALTKIALGRVRGKFGQVTLLGGGTIAYNELLQEGLQEKEKLEQELMKDYGEAQPPMFFLY